MEAQKDKWKPCLVLDLMSSEESAAEDSDSDDDHTFTVRPLPWRADKVTSFFTQLDKKYCKGQSKRSAIMTLKRQVGIPSDRTKPSSSDLPSWVVS